MPHKTGRPWTVDATEGTPKKGLSSCSPTKPAGRIYSLDDGVAVSRKLAAELTGANEAADSAAPIKTACTQALLNVASETMLVAIEVQ
jgi:hypothetical protein